MTNRDILDELRVRGELAERLKRMAPRYREIITLRYGLSFETGLIVRGEMTMEQVAKLYSITNERLRQIEKKVFKELSEGLTVSPWHTETPTEEGDYLVQYKNSGYDVLHFADLSWFAFNRGGVEWQKISDSSVIRWQKIKED